METPTVMPLATASAPFTYPGVDSLTPDDLHEVFGLQLPANKQIADLYYIMTCNIPDKLVRYPNHWSHWWFVRIHQLLCEES